MHELRGEPERTLDALLEKLSPVDLVLVEGFKRRRIPSSKSIAPRSASRCCIPRTRTSSRSRATAPVEGERAGGGARRYRGDRRHSGREGRAARCRRCARRAERLMAQLTDDCFAFGGPLLPIDDVERLIGERVTPVAETETCRAEAMRAGACSPADVVAPIDLPPFDNSAVDGYAVRHADLGADGETRLAIVDRADRRPRGRARGRSRARRSASSPARRCRPGADTVFMQEDVRAEGGAVIVPPGLKRGANRRLAGEDVARGAVALPAGRRLAAAGSRAWRRRSACATLPVRRRVRVAMFSTGDEIVEPGAPLPGRRRFTTPTAICSAALLAQLGRRGDRSRHPARRSGEARRARSPRRRAAMISCSPPAASRPARPIMCGTRSRAIGRSCSGASRSSRAGRSRWACFRRPATRAFVGLPGNPVAVFVTFARVVRPLLLRLAGAAAGAADRAAGARGICL